MIVARESMHESGGMFPQENLDPLRLLLTQSGTRLLTTCDKTLLIILNFKISGRGGNSSPPSV